MFIKPSFAPKRRDSTEGGTNSLAEALRSIRHAKDSVEEAAATFARLRESDTREEFYPLVSGLFRLLGLESEHSRSGVNYQRADARVSIEGDIAPIEIKSPTEERYLSTKAIRQALENKVVLLSRGDQQPRFDTTSLIVGYQIPNQRGDMSTLIDDVFETYGINIGVIDLQTLAVLAMRAVTEGLTIRTDQLRNLRGFLHA